MNHTVLFLCPHNAAKSVIAAAYFQRLADARGLPLRATSAGTEPSAQVSPAVVELLRPEGLNVSAHQPRRVTPADMATALRAVSLGCEPGDLPPAHVAITQWDDVPPTSQNLLAARDAINTHVVQLVDELAHTLSGKYDEPN